MGKGTPRPCLSISFPRGDTPATRACPSGTPGELAASAGNGAAGVAGVSASALPLTFSSPCPRAPDLRRAGSAYSGTSAVALSSPEGRGGPSHLTERLRHLHARLASWGWRRDSHMGFPSLIPFRRARGGTRDMSVTRPSPFVTGLRSAAGGWLSCQHPKHRARDAGSLGPLPSAVTARDAGGGGPQTAGR